MNRIWMVAEDDPVLRSILRMMLSLWEVDSLVFEDGNQAWAWLDQVECGTYMLPLPEVALLDVRMPGHPGHEVGQRMRGIVATSTIPLMIMTAYHLSTEDKVEIIEAAHPEHLVTKPVPGLLDFRRLIESVIAASKLNIEVPLTSGVDPIITAIAKRRWYQRRKARGGVCSTDSELKLNANGHTPENNCPD